MVSTAPATTVVTPAPDPSDAVLLARAAARDQQAFAVLVSRHYRPVYGLVWRLMNGHADAEDVTQQAFLKLWSDPGQLREAAALRGWLHRVAANLVTDRARRKPMSALDDAMEVADHAPSVEGVMAGTAAAAAVDRAIAGLPERQKLAVSLVHIGGMSNIDAAAAMAVSVEALESLLARARRGLKEALAGQKQELLAALTAGRE
jgi:RNA polymerase sigma-70 factor (ECF subfamily)